MAKEPVTIDMKLQPRREDGVEVARFVTLPEQVAGRVAGKMRAMHGTLKEELALADALGERYPEFLEQRNAYRRGQWEERVKAAAQERRGQKSTGEEAPSFTRTIEMEKACDDGGHAVYR